MPARLPVALNYLLRHLKPKRAVTCHCITVTLVDPTDCSTILSSPISFNRVKPHNLMWDGSGRNI